MSQQHKPNSVPQQHQQLQRQLKSLASGRQLEALVIERLELPEQVAEFSEFEELSKLYEIEQPFVPRTQVELLFDVYDGKKLRQGFGSLDEEEENADDANLGTNRHQSGQQGQGSNNQTQGQQARASVAANARRSSYVNQRRQSARLIGVGAGQQQWATSGASKRGGLSWCKTLFAKRQLNCCLRPSDTQQQLGLVSSSTSANSLAKTAAHTTDPSGQLQQASTPSSTILAAAQAALAPVANEPPGSRELKWEALRLLESALGSGASGRSSLEHCQLAAGFEAGLGPALAMESAQLESSGGCVSVCLLDKRHCRSLAAHDQLPAERANQAQNEPANGRLWARAASRLVQLRRRLRQSSSTKLAATLSQSGQADAQNCAKLNRSLLKQADELARKASRKFWAELSGDLGAPTSRRHQKAAAFFGAGQQRTRTPDVKLKKRKLHGEQLEQLVELVKGSLNQLIDAQLLLRNKLTLGLDQTSSLLVHQVRAAEYETLLRNNFNLLKIWQNLEESKRLVCFVCEPIRASLADLFAFNRQRLDWAPASHFESARLNGNTLATTNENGSSGGQLLLVSPLVSLDGVQLKRGLLQILEAINFLHAICKLVHRNLTPKNILICQNDNWKLSGLEFALRFESTTISESASLMAHEFSQALAPMLGKSASSTNSAPLSSGCNTSTSGAGAGGLLSAPSGPQLRRQRTLHQTKCEEFLEVPKCQLLQPDLDYLAPEILHSAKCSHKSDLFSFGLILGQAYDLCRHRPPLSCKSSAQNYDIELKKLETRRKLRLARQVPCELSALLVEMLDCEPNLRPSANYVLQLLKRPIELCRTNEESLKHLRNSLAYLDGRLQLGATQTTASGQQVGGINHELQLQQQQNFDGGASSGAKQARPARAIRSSYFKRVTSAAANREPAGRLQTRNLQLLNHLVRAIDFMVAPNGPAAQHCEPAAARSRPEFHAPTGSGRQSFCALRLQFEQTLDTLKQVFRWTGELDAEPSWTGGGGGGGGGGQSANCLAPLLTRELPGAGQEGSSSSWPADTRSLLLVVALHRRLLEQVAQMRAELPPICRLLATGTSGSQQPLDRSLASANHRALADVEERLHLIVSRQSMGRLAEWLADPLLKLDEFLLVFELVNDLVCFVGQRCKLNYAQRGKQLLQELTPFAGCPTLSSSEEEDEEEEALVVETNEDFDDYERDDRDDYQEQAFGIGARQAGRSDELELGDETSHMQQQFALDSRGPASCRLNGQSVARMNNRIVPQAGGSSGIDQQQQDSSLSTLKQHRQQQNYNNSNYQTCNRQGQQSGGRPSSRQRQHQHQNQQQPFQLPTSINITAPSPMGSARDISRASLVSSSATESCSLVSNGQQALFSTIGQQQPPHQTGADSHGGRGSFQFQKQSQLQQAANIKRHSHQDVTTAASASDQTADYLAERTSQMSVSSPQGRRLPAGVPVSSQFCERETGQEPGDSVPQDGSEQAAPDEKSRSKLIDELLKTINDDSFNDFIDFNNKLNAASSSAKSELELINSQRPKSAIGTMMGGASGLGGETQAAAAAAAYGANQSGQPGDTTNRPRTLNLNSNAATSATNAQAAANRYQTRGSICVGGAQVQQNQQTSTFDNVIRRMSTNFVQNLNKMSGSALGGDNQNQQHQHQPSCTSTSSTNLRREKSNTSTYANSLFVDTSQVPARRHSDNTINVPRIQVALSSPSSAHSGSRSNLNQRASVSASKLANKWKLSVKSNQRETGDKLSPNLSGALGYMRRHSSGNTTNGSGSGSSKGDHHQQSQSNGGLGAQLLNASPFKQTKSSSNLGLDFLLSNRSMKRRCSAASMLGHQTQRKAEDLLDAGMKSVQNMFS